MAATSTSPYSTRFKVMAVVVLALAISAFVAAYLVTSSEGDNGSATSGNAVGDDIVEQRIPAPNSQVPQQSTVGIDLVSGWEGTLQVNNVEIPKDQLTLTPELSRIEFRPGDGKVVEELQAGLNCVNAIVWPIPEGRDAARQIQWCFTVV